MERKLLQAISDSYLFLCGRAGNVSKRVETHLSLDRAKTRSYPRNLHNGLGPSAFFQFGEHKNSVARSTFIMFKL